MNNSVFAKTIGNMRKHRDMKLTTTEKKKKLLGATTNLSQNKTCTLKFITHRNKKETQAFLKKAVYLGLSIFELSKRVMSELWYDCLKPKYGTKWRVMLVGYRQFHSLHKNR